MTTDIELRPTGAVDQPTAADAHPAADLLTWAESARAAHNIAQSLAATSFVPQAFRGKPGEITAAILTGNEMGLSPMASLRAFDLIQGTPAMRAHAMRGVVQAHGHEIWYERATPTKVIACGQRKDSDKVHRSEWTIERAQQMKLTEKAEWKKQPQAMLTARATSEVCRLTASDVLYGVPYSVEELGDLGAERLANKRTARRKLEPVPAPEPDFPQQAEAPDPETETADTSEPATEQQADAWADIEVAQPGSGA